MNRLFWLACATLVLTGTALTLPPFGLLSASTPEGSGAFYELVLSRTVMALSCGAVLAGAGYLIQTVLQNPMASPTTLGIMGGALTATIIAEWLVPGQWQWLATLGGAGLAASVTLFASRAAGGGTHTTLLTGMALSLVLSGLNSGLLLLFENRLEGVFLWGAGSLDAIRWTGTLESLPFFLLACALLCLSMPALRVFRLGQSPARLLGVGALTVYGTLGLAVAVSSLATYHAGILGFAGLASPHIARAIPDRSYPEPRMPEVMLAGMAVTIGADILARLLSFGDLPIPTGALTALIGTPILLILIWRVRSQNQPEASARLDAAHLKLPATASLTILAGGIVLLVLTESSLNLDRLLVGGLAGGALGISGMLYQSILRNPVAGPDISGASGLAILGVAICLSFWPDAPRQLWPLIAGLSGLIVVPLMIRILKRDQLAPARVAVAGLGLAALCSTLATLVLVMGGSQQTEVLAWMSGSLWAADPANSIPLVTLMVIMIPWLFTQTSLLQALQLDPFHSRSLGIIPERGPAWLLAGATLLAALAAGVAGGMGFTGFLAPHIARLLGLRHPTHLLSGSFLSGALLVMMADALGREMMAPFEMTTGVVASGLGGSILALLVCSRFWRHTPALGTALMTHNRL
ncbi:iron chelate uptake ABC transporter family permease subunit [Hahella sp. SMD15-11]|uniref:Iron chelate uptake ABC transporter family permease subunit n=1 Tax=Thermohahella caldifontis TaxID=3142973 RepID=A0AB39UTM8_9GAMM